MNRTRAILGSVIALMIWGAATLAGPDEEPAPEKTSGPLPSLDELLGLDDASDKEGQDAVVDPNEAALDAVLSPRQAGEAFSQAVGLMNQVAQRIGEGHDLSITTQRLQEDILRKLDRVIASAKNNSQGGGGSSSSSAAGRTSEQQPDQRQQSQQEGDQNGPSTEPGDAPMPAGTSTPRPGEEAAPSGVGWGSLPARVRDALSQGISDEYSQLYRSITERYYKALAEEERP